MDVDSPRLLHTADTPPAPRAAAVPTSSSCCPASRLSDGPDRIYARVNGPSTLLFLRQRHTKKKKKSQGYAPLKSPLKKQKAPTWWMNKRGDAQSSALYAQVSLCFRQKAQYLTKKDGISKSQRKKNYPEHSESKVSVIPIMSRFL